MTTLKRISALALALVFVLAMFAVPTKSAQADETFDVGSGGSPGDIVIKSDGQTSSELTLLYNNKDCNFVVTSGAGNVDLSATTGTSTVVEGVLPGEATIRIENNNDVTDFRTVNVRVIQQLEVVLNNNSASFASIGDTAVFSAAIKPDAFADKFTLNWSSENNNVATVSPSTTNATNSTYTSGTTATVTAGAVMGDTKVKVSTSGSTTYFRMGSAEITIGNDLTGVNLTIDGTKKFYDWQSFLSNATVMLRNANVDYPANCRVEWYSNNKDVAEVIGDSTTLLPSGHDSLATATIKTKANGRATITATIINPTNSSKKYSKSYQLVVEKPVPTIRLTTDTNELNASRRTAYLTVAVTDPTGTIDSNGAIRMTSSNSRMTSVSAGTVYMSGFYAYPYAYAHYNGTATITARIAGTREEASVTLRTTGLSYLPQTGQNGAALYVIGGLCLIMFVTAGALYIRRKKSIEG